MADTSGNQSNQEQQGYFKSLWESFKKQSKKIKFFLEIAALIIVVCYTRYAGQQAGAAIKAADAAESAAHAANDNVTLTRENAHLDQRAWIGIGDIRGQPEVNQIWEVVVVFHNSGRTFAKNFSGYAVVDPRKGTGDFPDFSYAHDKKFSGGLISPSGDHNVKLTPTRGKSTGQPSPLNDELSRRITNGQLRIFVHGFVTYDDIFGVNHWLSFCYFWHQATKGYGACDMHNDTGDNK